ncbi:putative capsular associated protein [Aspergillus candidus]|uniref:Glycosyl transferase CAP10 domain-containing protein n=1 Tax=Aspergillus candidus TaxID=41067 RepID=A0A2I2FLB1_ASPCN|nr:hypothetical protein BDW47DRAFT_99049 [Aspergillus candidus]PLB41425.1 hypothetical protein BDW47DRAFT_99049 [Aspergillus candidus]
MVTLFSQETGLRASLGVFILSCTVLSTSYNTTFAFDHPVKTAILTCYLAAFTLFILSFFIPTEIKSSSPQKYTSIPLTERDETLEEASLSSNLNGGHFPSTRKFNRRRWAKVLLLSAVGSIRVALYREFTIDDGCTPAGYTWAIPFLVALYDYIRNQRARPTPKWTQPDGPSNVLLRSLINLVSRVHFYVCQTRVRYLISTVLLLIGGMMTSDFEKGRQSTFICPITSGHYPRLRMFKVLSTLLDCVILIGAGELAPKGGRSRDGRGRKQSLISWGLGFLGVALVWTTTDIIAQKTSSIWDDGGFVSSHFLRSSVCQGLLVTLVVVSASQLIPSYGAVGLATLAGFICIYFTWSSALFNGQQPFPLIFPSYALFSLLSVFLSVIVFLAGRTACGDEPEPLHVFNIAIRAFTVFLFGIGLILASHQPSVAHLHPIDLLIHDSQQQHSAWLARANISESLTEAVRRYRDKYQQHPPPGFDKWFEYATSRKSVVLDEFDQIHENLLPFRALSPQQIREETHLLNTNPWNSIGGLLIRNGTVRIQEGIKPTHAWMVGGAIEIIQKFVEHLPDMDIAFNLDDEPRVAVPWEKMSVFKGVARSGDLLANQDPSREWSEDRSETWPPIEPADQSTDTRFVESSFKNIFDRYVSVLCPPSSKARSQRIWDRTSTCLGCVRPHSLGQFPSNWEVATDICHQPDLAFLHGFIQSPASFKVSQELIPVFSQSALHGFSDILYPSPWNYVDKAVYSPSEEFPDEPYEDKENRLFWIGATSEGTSAMGQWKGKPRQRLTHLVNNNTLSKVAVLLPTEIGAEPPTYSYQVLDGRAPLDILGLEATVQLSQVDHCSDGDCEEQVDEFHPSGHIDFQGHWAYRFLFDADGAGFSGRFLPFLLSHSLPFRTGLFRQWFDSRLTAWMHFVPVDLRLHGLWSTLAYFAGADITLDVDGSAKRKLLMEPHSSRGRWIAESGREWAQQVLRKEDMEIYFFRLLLEWGRLTDDRRDELGFKL